MYLFVNVPSVMHLIDGHEKCVVYFTIRWRLRAKGRQAGKRRGSKRCRQHGRHNAQKMPANVQDVHSLFMYVWKIDDVQDVPCQGHVIVDYRSGSGSSVDAARGWPRCTPCPSFMYQNKLARHDAMKKDLIWRRCQAGRHARHVMTFHWTELIMYKRSSSRKTDHRRQLASPSGQRCHAGASMQRYRRSRSFRLLSFHPVVVRSTM